MLKLSKNTEGIRVTKHDKISISIFKHPYLQRIFIFGPTPFKKKIFREPH